MLFWALFVAMSGFDGGFNLEAYTSRYCYCVAFSEVAKLRKLAVCKVDLSRGGLTRCHGVLDHGLNLHRNIPLITVKATKWKPSLPLLSSPLSCSKWSECVPRSKRLEIRVSIMVASVHLHASPPPSKVPSKVGVWLGKHFTDDSVI